MKLTEIEGNVKFNKWDTEQAKQLYGIVKKMRELKNSNALRDTEKRLPNDLQEVEKYADGQPQQDSMRQNILLQPVANGIIGCMGTRTL